MALRRPQSARKSRKKNKSQVRIRQIVSAAARVPGEDMFMVVDGQVRIRNKDMCFSEDSPDDAPFQTLLTAHALEGGRHALTAQEVAQAIARVLNERVR